MPMSCSLAAIRLAKAFGAVAAVLVTAVPGPAAVAQPWRPVAQAGGAGEGPAPGVILVGDAAAATGFPDAATAGVPDGAALETYTGPMEISE
ncbi:hypothetical protein, partial [Mycoplana sp. MJR14]|uniref:hypothetical protein n=1 Tax=Mycoplana sp. MJR14 TaxID=3032583 RepID=UPI0023D99985